MKKIVFTIWMFTFLVPVSSFGQQSEVYEELSDAFDYGKNANEFAISTLDYIKKCYQQYSIDDIQYYARRAKNEIENAKYQSDYAASYASDAENKAEDINCDDAEDKADDAEGNFYTAKSRFDDAYTYLRRAENSENEDDMAYNLRKAISYIEEGINYINNALSDLNDSVEGLNDCN